MALVLQLSFFQNIISINYIIIAIYSLVQEKTLNLKKTEEEII